MSKPLTPAEYFKLDRLRMRCELMMQDPLIVAKTNVLQMYQLATETINHETDPYLQEVIQILSSSTPQ